MKGALAAEGVGLRARLEQSFRHAAGEVLEFIGPSRWPFVDRRAEIADEEFLFDLLDDAVVQETELSRITLEQAAAGGLRVSAAFERFRAFFRGVLAGGLVARFLHDDFPMITGGRTERATLAAVERALVRRLPDLEGELFLPLAQEIEVAHARARGALAEEQIRAELRRLVRAERLQRPLIGLAKAVESLPNGGDPPPASRR
jgi:hypothetical protein